MREDYISIFASCSVRKSNVPIALLTLEWTCRIIKIANDSHTTHCHPFYIFLCEMTRSKFAKS